MFLIFLRPCCVISVLLVIFYHFWKNRYDKDGYESFPFFLPCKASVAANQSNQLAHLNAFEFGPLILSGALSLLIVLRGSDAPWGSKGEILAI